MIHAYLAAIAALTVESPAPVPVSSSTDQLVTVAAAGIASIVVAAIGAFGLRRRRQKEYDVATDTLVYSDPQDRMSNVRERLARLETRADRTDRDMADFKEQLQLHRAADIVTEASVSPRHRRRDGTG